MGNCVYGLVTTSFRLIIPLSLPGRRVTIPSSTAFSSVHSLACMHAYWMRLCRQQHTGACVARLDSPLLYWWLASCDQVGRIRMCSLVTRYLLCVWIGTSVWWTNCPRTRGSKDTARRPWNTLVAVASSTTDETVPFFPTSLFF